MIDAISADPSLLPKGTETILYEMSWCDIFNTFIPGKWSSIAVALYNICTDARLSYLTIEIVSYDNSNIS
jgi:hypothetical protein